MRGNFSACEFTYIKINVYSMSLRCLIILIIFSLCSCSNTNIYKLFLKKVANKKMIETYFTVAKVAVSWSMLVNILT